MNTQFDPSIRMLRISVPGDLLSPNADYFRSEALSLVEAQSGASLEWLGVEVDLTSARMVDSAGLNAIVSVIRRLKSLGKQTLIRVKDPHVHRVCLFTRLDLQAEIVRI